MWSAAAGSSNSRSLSFRCFRCTKVKKLHALRHLAKVAAWPCTALSISCHTLRSLVGIDEARIGIGVVGEHAMARPLIEPWSGRLLARLEERRLSSHGPPVARDEQPEKIGIISEDHVALSSIAIRP